MGWLQVINYECKNCGKQYLIQAEAEACFDKHKEKKNECLFEFIWQNNSWRQ